MSKITNIRKACKLSDQAFSFIVSNIKAGLTEKEVAKLIKGFIAKKKARLAFPIIVASGPNAYNLHNKPTDRRVKKGEPIILDFGAKVGDYCSDMTRTVFLGRITLFWRRIYKIVLDAQRKSLLRLRKERSGLDVDRVARLYIDRAGYGKNFIHTLGHSFGKKAHDGKVIGPKSKDILKANDAVTIEPGIYIKGRGGIRIEDDVLIKKFGIEILTRSPKTLSRMIIK